VQAAHAGEAGAAFAVVADKVRELADGASAASAQIVARLSAIRDHAVHAASVMTGVCSRVEGIDAFTTAVAHAAADQEAGTAEITEAIAEAERSVGEVVRAVEDITEVGMVLTVDAERGLEAARAMRETVAASVAGDERSENEHA
jgi:methyl-accepting chemotaxis protein